MRTTQNRTARQGGMKWSWRIGSISGIDVYIHATFLLIVLWVILSHWVRGSTLAGTLAGLAFTLAIFGCVLLHEFGHALAAKRYNIRTRDITLLPIGGLARLERMPDQPRQELWVALAGPAVNVVIAILLFVWLSLTGAFQPISQISVAEGSLLERLMLVNVILVLFNLIPAFPMDGGRVLRALLATRMEYTSATQIAAMTGQGFAFLFGAIGLFGNPMLLFVALFIWIGASQESSLVQMQSSLGGIPVSRAMITDFQLLHPGDKLARAVELIIAGSQQEFPVVENGTVVGILPRKETLIALGRSGSDTPVTEVMRRDICPVDSSDMLETAFASMSSGECHTLPVLHGGRLVGLLTMENVGEFIAIQAAMKRGRPIEISRIAPAGA
jgi:Zn-dependent protease/predicted transcriptional regulator